MKSYKITFSIREGKLSFTDIPTFDALLAYCYFKEYHDKPIQDLSYETLIDFSPMPICKDNNGLFLASSMQWNKTEEVIEYNQVWRKKWHSKDDSLVDFKKKKRQIQVARGEFKSYEVPFIIKLIDSVWFYFNSESITEVEALLKHLKGIGKKTSQGFGIIENYQIKEVENIDFQKTILRPVPKEAATKEQVASSHQESYCGYQPPYWEGRNMDLCLIPL